MTRSAPALATVTSLLERQRRALLAGDLGALDGIALRLEAALAHLAEARLSRADLAGIAALAAHNARLTEAARAGVAQARARLSARSSAPLMTYDARGRQTGCAPPGQTLSRR